MRKKISILETMILIYLIIQLISGIGTLIINEQYNAPYKQKLLITGVIIDLDYFNMTFENDVNFNIITDNSMIIKYYCNLTIKDIISNSLKNVILEKYIIIDWNIKLGSIIYVWKNAPFIEISN